MRNRRSFAVVALLLVFDIGWHAVHAEQVPLGDRSISVEMPGVPETVSGRLRSLPDGMSGPIITSLVGVVKYHATLCDLPAGMSLHSLALKFAANEMEHQKRWPKESEDEFVRNSRYFVDLYPPKSSKFQGREVWEFSIEIDVLIPAFGYSPAFRNQVGQHNVRLIRVGNAAVVMVREQFFEPFPGPRTVQRFFDGLKLPAEGMDAAAGAKPRKLAAADEEVLPRQGKWHDATVLPVTVVARDGWTVRAAEKNPATDSAVDDQSESKRKSASESLPTGPGLLAEWELDGLTASLSVEYHKLPDAGFDAFVQSYADSPQASDGSQQFHPELKTSSVLWRFGRRCWQLDVHRFEAKDAVSTRTVFVPGADAVVVLIWSTDKAGDLSRVDTWMDRMVRITVPETAPGRGGATARSVLNWFEDYAVFSKPVVSQNEALNDRVRAYGEFVDIAQSEFRKNIDNGSVAESVDALAALNLAKQEQTKIEELQRQRIQQQMHELQQHFRKDYADLLQSTFPELAAQLAQ